MTDYHNNTRSVPPLCSARHEYKIMFGTATFMACCIFLGIVTIFNAHHQVNLQPSAVVGDLAADKSIALLQEPTKNKTITPIICNKGGRSAFCDMRGDIRIDPSSPIIYYLVPTEANPLTMTDNYLNPLSSLTIRPYGRNDDEVAMESVREWSIRLVPENNPSVPNCSQFHHSPGVMFSLGGFSLNLFHAFTDVIVPLFATTRPFNRQVELLVTDYQPWVAAVHRTILQALSRYKIVDIDDEQKKGGRMHCFSRLTLGLKGRGKMELSINSSESAYTMRDFQQFLKTAYNLKKTTAIKLQDQKSAARPRLLIISRNNTRTFTNINEIAKLSREVGYDVIVAEPYEDTSKYAQMVNSCDVVIGVHGAGLANMLFLPANAVLIQVIPVGLVNASKLLYEEPLKALNNLRYLDYKIGKKESSLIDKYPPDHDVFTKPWLFERQGLKVFRSIYFENQNVKLDLNRFRPTLLKALELLHQ